MKAAAIVALVLGAAVVPVWADDASLERLATCQESWLDWHKSDPARMKLYVDQIHSGFSQNGNDAFMAPKAATSIFGLRVTQLFPDSVGMGFGFSVLLNGSFDAVRKVVEKKLGKSLGKCDDGENMRSCELEIGEKRTVMLMAQDDPKTNSALLGCYYYYEK
jgi:hypothetical protein